MKKFKFKFEKILKIKIDIEEQAKQNYAFCLQKKTALVNENQSLVAGFYANIEEDMANMKAGDKLNMSTVFYEEGYGQAAKIRIAQNNEKIVEFDRQLEELQAALKKASVERKIFEKLKDKAVSEYNDELNKYENAQIDEMSTNKFYQDNLKEES